MRISILEKSVNLAKKLVLYQLIIAILAGFLLPISTINANEPLAVSNIKIVKTDKTATISWQTNREAYGTVKYGLYPDDYHWKVNTNKKDTVQAITISGLFPDTTYFIRIVADDETSEVASFEQNFKTGEVSDNRSPVISDVQVVYTTGSTATIQWFTNEKATSEVEYGMTEQYGKTYSNGQKVKIHDITIKGLIDGTQYHFRVKSKDADNNASKWYDMVFRTKLTNQTDRDELIIYSIKPSSENNLNVSETTAVISWRTNKLAKGWVRYGTTLSYGKTAYTNPPRDFTNSITLTDLQPGQNYYFEINAQDVLEKKVKSDGHSFTTKSTAVQTTNYQPATGQILGASTLDVDLKTDFGFYGIYYNLTEDLPGMELYQGKEIPNSKTGRENYWYNPEYFSFSQIDNDLDFGRNFFPIDENKPGDPYHFAVIWRAIINVPADDSYEYKITSDDDSWIFIDDKLVSDLNGVHPAKTNAKTVYLTADYHKLEIYFAERSRGSSVFSFTADSRLKFHPLPEGYEISDVLEYNEWLYGTGGVGGPTPTVLGVSNITQSSIYACNPDLGYTKIRALYKTADSPDIWAILETGQKHYITSPQAFNQYQCDWGKVKTVSRKTLDSYPNATLVRTPDDPTIYHLFQRPNHQWLKINIPSPTIFVNYPDNYWGNVARINALDIQAYPNVRLIKAENSQDTYLIEGTSKRRFQSADVFNRLGYDWAEVVELNQIHLDSYIDGVVVID